MADECQHDAACQAVAAVCGESDEGGNNSCRFGLYFIVQNTQIRLSALCQRQQFACLLRLGLLHLVEFTARGKPKRMRAVQRDAVLQGGTYMGNCCATTNCIRVRMRLEAASPCWLLRVPLRSAAQLGFTLNPKPDPCPNPCPAAQRRMRQRRSLFSGRGRIQAQSPMTWTAASLAKHAAASIQSPFKVFCSLQSAFGRASRSLFIHRRLPQPRRRCRRKPKSENRTRRRPRQPRPPQRRHRQHAVRQRRPSSRSSKPRRQCTPRPRISARYMRRAALAAPPRLAAPLPPQPRMAAAAPQTPPLWTAGRLPDLMEGSAAARAHAAMLGGAACG